MNTLNKLIDRIAHRMPPAGYGVLTLIATASILWMGTRPGTALRPVASLLAQGMDKALHFTAYASLAACAFRTLYPFDPNRPARISYAWLWVLLVPFLVGALDETLQSMTPGRASDWHDLLADTLGGVFVVALGLWGRRATTRS